MVVLTKFRAQLSDTTDTAFERIASTLSTLPKYLYFPDGVPTIEDLRAGGDFEVVDLLTEIKKPVTVNALIKNLSTKIDQQGLSWGNDVFSPYIAFSETLKNSDTDMLGARLIKYDRDIQKVAPGFNTKEMWDNRNSFTKNFTSSITYSSKRSKDAEIRSKALNKLKAGIPSTDIFVEAVTLKFSLDLGVTFGSPLEVFNYIVTSPSMPFTTTNDVYKILKDLDVPRSWAGSDDESIRFKIQASLPGAPPRYMDGMITAGETSLLVEVELDVSKPTVSTDEVVSRVVGAFPTLSGVTTGAVTHSTVKGSFNFPKTSFNVYIFSDMVLNDPLFSQYITIKESDKATKAKKSGLYFSFDHSDIGHISAVLTDQSVTEQTPQSLRKDNTRFPLNSSFIRVRISRSHNRESAEKFRVILSQLMAVYISKAPALTKIYKQFIPSFTVDKIAKVSKEKRSTLQDIDGDVFVEYYSRWCREGKQPTIVSDAKAKAAEKRGLEVMVYPRPGPDVVRRNYICEKEGFPWPGVQKNNTGNADRYPYIPCCFANSQKNSKKYREYFAGGAEAEDDSGERDHSQILKEKKILKNNAYGELLPNISKVFNIVDPEDGFSYLRHGMHRSKSSFLDCVLTANGINGIQHMTKVDERLEEVAKIREQLATPKHAALCRQEMYDSTIEDIVKDIKDPDVYLDPRLYVTMLETVYNCQIFLFTSARDGGTMEIPRFKEGYYKTKRTVPCVAIYEHWGSEANQAKYPQCEMIMKWNATGTRDWEVMFEPDDQISIGLEAIEAKLRSAYTLGKHIPDTSFPALDRLRKITPPKSVVTILGQGIDSYGKCRAILVKYKKVTATLLTSPMPPFPVVDLGKDAVERVDIASALKLAAEIGLPVSAQIVHGGMVEEIRGKIGLNISVIIPVSNSSPIGGIPEFDGSPEYPITTTSALTMYNKGKQMARYLTEYTIWLYSKFIGDEPMTMDSFAAFGRNRIVIRSNHQYKGHITGELSMSSPVMDGDKLVVGSKEVEKRLLFGLRLACMSEPSRVRNYKNGTNVPNFYMDLADFDQYSNQVILIGTDSIEKWIADLQTQKTIQSSIVVYTVHEDSTTYTSYPVAYKTDASISTIKKEGTAIVTGRAYFFKNKLVGPDVYLAQNASSIRESVGIFQKWQQEHYNPVDTTNDYIVPSFTLYSYVNSGNITPNYITGEQSQDSGMKVIGYLVAGVEQFTVLLPL